MRHTLHIERAAREDAEARLEEEVRLRAAAEERVAALQAALAQLETAHRAYVVGATETIVTKLARFADAVADTPFPLLVPAAPRPADDTAASAASGVDGTGQEKMVEAVCTE